MRMTVRRDRRRRTGSDSPGFARSRLHSPFFDRLEFLSQSINQTRKTDTPFIILATRDIFLRTGFQHGPSPMNNCDGYTQLEPAIEAMETWPRARLIVDVEHLTKSIIDTLSRLRRVSLHSPHPVVHLLIRADDYDTRLFCKATGPFHIIDRQTPANALLQALAESNPEPTKRREWFSREEWLIIQALSQGESLKTIALHRDRPYHRIVYRTARILNKLGLNHRQELLILLHRLSEFAF